MSTQKASVAVSSGATIKKTAAEVKHKRLNVHGVIVGAIQELGDKASPQKIEELGQKVKKASKGKYERIASQEYVVSKEGIVRAQLSDIGFKRVINFYNKTYRWGAPEKLLTNVKEKAKELKLEIKPAPAKKEGKKTSSPSPTSTRLQMSRVGVKVSA